MQPIKIFHFRELDLTRNLTAILVVGVSIYMLWLFVLTLLTPGDGLGIYLGEEVVVKQVSTDIAVRPGDVILKIDSLHVDDNLLKPGFWRTALSSGKADSVRYTLLRNGKIFYADLSWQRPSLSQLFLSGGALFIVGLLCLALAMFILTQPRYQSVSDAIKELLALDFTFLALNQINNVFPASSANVCLTWAWLFMPIDLLSIVTFASLALHCLLVFPEVKAPLQHFPKLVWTIYLVPPLLSLLGGITFGDQTVLGFRNALFSFANPLMALEMGLGLGALAHTYFKSRRPGVRNQIRWLLWGIVLAVSPWLLFYVIPSLVWGAPWLPLAITNITVSFIPLSFVMAALRYGLMEVDRIVNRTIVYLLLTGLLAVIYLWTVSVSRRLLLIQDGASNDFVAGIIAAVVIFLLFNPLRIYTERLIARILYREQFDFPVLIQDISQELSSTILLEDTVALLTQDVPRRLSFTRAQVMLLDERQRFYQVWRSVSSARLPVESPLVSWLRVHRFPLILHQVGRLPVEVQPHAKALMDPLWELCLPLYHHNALIGLYLLGSKTSGSLINRQQVEVLTLFAHQAAAALQNAQLYLALKDYSQHLENRVAARTAELLGERDRLDTILRNIADGLVVTDITGKIVLTNPAFSYIARQGERDVLERALCKVLPFQGLGTIINQALGKPGEVFTNNLVEVLPSGAVDMPRVYKASACAFLQRYTPLPGHPETMPPEASGVVTVLRDITLEMEIDRMKTDFISTVSHELRTPLTSVLGFAKLIGRTFDRDILPKLVSSDQKTQRAATHISNNLDIIISEGNRLTRLINDVLDVSKMESGKGEWHMDWVNPVEVIQRAVAAIALLVREKGLLLKVKFPDELSLVYGDCDRLIQVVTNLLSNAIKFTDTGYIEVQVRELQATCGEDFCLLGSRAPVLQPGEWLAISVKDTGIGIAEHNLQVVFERFQQIGDALTDRPKGTGLGLTICREIIAHHGGAIWAESTPDAGSVFTFILPVAPDRPASTSKPTGIMELDLLDPQVKGALILVVDDEANIRRLLHQELKEAGYRPVVVASGGEALQQVTVVHPDLIILDVRMPGLDGLDVLCSLKKDPATAEVPVILLSIFEDGEKGLRLGADAYHTKPLDMAKLIATMDMLLSRIASRWDSRLS